MPKDKSSRTQSRKKQGTDVSDGLFHVTPQPSIDIFEVLGGAINVQTAAFLTGKVDSLNAPIEQPVGAPINMVPVNQIGQVGQVGQVGQTEQMGQASPVNQGAALQDAPSVDVVTADPSVNPTANATGHTIAETATPAPTTASATASATAPAPASQQAQTEPQQAPQTELSSPATSEQSATTKAAETGSKKAKKASEAPAPEQAERRNEGTSKATKATSPSLRKGSLPSKEADIEASKTAENDASDHAIKGAILTSIENSMDTSMANSMDTSMATSTASFDPQNSMLSSMLTSTPTSMATSTPNSIAKTGSEATSSTQENSTSYSTQIPLPLSISADPQAQQKTMDQTLKRGGPLLSKMTKREEELLQFLHHNNGQIVSYSQMLKTLNWRESQRCTARNIIARFESNGIIQRQRIQGTRSQGYVFTLCDPANPPSQQEPQTAQQCMLYTQDASPQSQQPNPTQNMQNSIPQQENLSTSEMPSTSTQTSTPNSMANSTPYYMKIDRLNLSISIWQSDQDTIAACWPAVAAAGFRSAHLRQLQSIFELQGFEPDTVSLGLRYLDWQLEQGPLTNARGEVIDDPIAYWLSSMRRHGYYGRPKGYLDPLLEAKRLLAEEEQIKLELQAQIDQARQQTEQAAEDQRCEQLFTALTTEGPDHALWPAFYASLPQMFRQKVDAEGPNVLAKKYGMLKALLKELV